MKIANTKLLAGAFMALTLTMLSPAVLANVRIIYFYKYLLNKLYI